MTDGASSANTIVIALSANSEASLRGSENDRIEGMEESAMRVNVAAVCLRLWRWGQSVWEAEWRKHSRSRHRMRFWPWITAGSSARSRRRRRQAENGWLPATVPGDVHLDLLANKKIPDPFYRDNESKLQWIENESWEYRLNFDVTPALLARSNVDLVFDGLDAAAQVYLNGVQVLDAQQHVPHLARAGEGPSARRQESAARRVSIAHQGRGSGGGQRSVAAEDEDRGQDLHPQGRL